MKLYRTLWNVQDSEGAIVPPGRVATLDDQAAEALAALGAIDPKPVDDAQAPSAEERLVALLALVPTFQVGDFTQAGQLRAEARRRIAAELGFEPTDEEIRAAGEAYTKAQTA